MYLLPDDLDEFRLVGHVLEQVAFTRGTIAFHFRGRLEIEVTAEHGVVYTDPRIGRREVQMTINNGGSPETSLLRLLEGRVTATTRASLSDLELTFESDETLRFLGPLQQYEMYTITIDGVDFRI